MCILVAFLAILKTGPKKLYLQYAKICFKINYDMKDLPLSLSVCRHNGFCAITFVLVCMSFWILTQWPLAQNKGWDWINFSGLLMGHEISAVLFIKGLKEVQIPKYCRFEICIEFLFFIQFWCAFSLNWLCCKLQVVCWLISPISYSFWDNLDGKRLKSAKLKNLNVFILNFNLKLFKIIL